MKLWQIIWALLNFRAAKFNAVASRTCNRWKRNVAEKEFGNERRVASNIITAILSLRNQLRYWTQPSNFPFRSWQIRKCELSIIYLYHTVSTTHLHRCRSLYPKTFYSRRPFSLNPIASSQLEFVESKLFHQSGKTDPNAYVMQHV